MQFWWILAPKFKLWKIALRNKLNTLRSRWSRVFEYIVLLFTVLKSENCQFFLSFSKYYDKEFKAENNQLNQAYLELEITLNNKDLARHAEFFIYNWVDFMSEIGGYLGLFLGYALLSIVDFVENIWKNICKPEIKPADDEVLLPMRRQRRTNSPMLVPRRRVLLSPNHTAIGQKSNFGWKGITNTLCEKSYLNFHAKIGLKKNQFHYSTVSFI